MLNACFVLRTERLFHKSGRVSVEFGKIYMTQLFCRKKKLSREHMIVLVNFHTLTLSMEMVDISFSETSEGGSEG